MAESITLDLEQSFADLSECVLVTDSERTIVYANKAMEELVQVKREDLVGSTMKRFFADPSQYERMAALYSLSPKNQRNKAYGVEIIRSDGTFTSVEVVSAPLCKSPDELSGLLFIAHDISERKALENKLSDIALTLEDALDSISEGFAIFDKDDRLVICNDNYREIYAHSAPAIFPGSRFEDMLRYGLRQNQYDTGGLSDEEWLAERLAVHVAADGSVIEQNLDDGRWLRISETRTRSGGIAGIRADITELKVARAEAESAYKNLALIADNVSASISEVTPDGICLFINRAGCEWFNSTADKLVGTRLREQFPWKEREFLKSTLEEAKKGDKVSVETSLHFPDGIRRECRFDCNPRFNGDGGVDGLVILVTDITDRKRSERTLAELNALTSTRELSHEEKISEILRLGCEHFELPFGIISHVLDDQYTITHAQSPDHTLVPGTVFSLKDTYCIQTLKAEAPLATAHASESDFSRHPCYQIFNLETYIGAPLLVDGVVHGTINFSAPDIRKRPFSAADIQIVRQFADWIGYEIARQRDHQALMDAKTNLERVASTDDLTEVLNRRALLEQAEREVQRFRRSKQPLTAVMLDIDHFKQINDQHGHATGDAVLKKFAQTVTSSLRAVDIFGRVGGEEFCLILHETGLDKALVACERLRKKIIKECQFEEIGQTITCSMGLAAAEREDVEFSPIMQKADTALYAAKAAGRNRCVCYEGESNEKFERSVRS